jgi:outer membrane protein TolC
MSPKVINLIFSEVVLMFCFFFSSAQPTTLTLRTAIQTALANYGSIKAKNNYLNSSRALLDETRKEYLPDLSISAQQDYGSVNGQNGVLYGYRGLSTGSSGPALSAQNWNAAFGGLYLANINWDFFSFGKAKLKIRVSKSVLARDSNDLSQEQFQQKIKVAAAYLNLLAAQRLYLSQLHNLDRALALRTVVVSRAKNGLNAGVDSSLANAEVSAARIALTRAKDVQQENNNHLAELMGVVPEDFRIDTFFIARIPYAISDSIQSQQTIHPVLKFYQSRISLSNDQARYFRSFNFPTFSLFSVFQGRGSGFDYDYGELNPGAYTNSYIKGISPARGNYLAGVGMIWNLTNPLRVQQLVASQKFLSRAFQDEYDLVDQQLKDQLLLARSKMDNALENYKEVPVQLKAAEDAYLQKTVLYKNGLTNIVDVTQTLYALYRAEADRDITYANVWQALLLRAAASGDFLIFENEF